MSSSGLMPCRVCGRNPIPIPELAVPEFTWTCRECTQAPHDDGLCFDIYRSRGNFGAGISLSPSERQLLRAGNGFHIDNTQRDRQRAQDYKAAHRDRVHLVQMEWKHRNAEWLRTYGRARYADHADYFRFYMRDWYAENRERVCEARRKRYAERKKTRATSALVSAPAPA